MREAGRTVLITMGRLPKALEAARALHRRGVRVVVADPFRWHLCRASRFVAKSYRVRAPNPDRDGFVADLRAIVARERPALIVPISEETLHVAAAAPSLDAPVFALALPLLEELHDKHRFMERVRGAGLPHPETHRLGSDGARRFAAANAHIVKPTCSSAGSGFLRRAAGEPLPEARVPSVVQALLPGREWTSFSLLRGGRLLGTVVYRGLIFSGTVAVAFERVPDPPAAIVDWVARFAAGLGTDGFLSFDFKEDAAGVPRVMECNPRATSGIHFVAGDDLAAALLEPESATSLRPGRDGPLQQFFPALTETQGAALKGRPWRGNLRLLFGARDVCWTASDPLPLLTMPLNSAEILVRTIFRGKSFGEATTEDIGWYPAGGGPAS